MSPSQSWKEVIGPDEPARHAAHAAFLLGLQRSKALPGKPSRALHAKGNAGLEAELEVLPDLPAAARAGLFGAPSTYRAYVRFSNGSAAHQRDRKGDVRGVAIKLVGVPGKKIIPGMEDAPTQDFLLIRTPATPFRNSDEFVGLLRALQNPLLALPRLVGAFGAGRAVALLRQLARGVGAPMPSLATARYYSALPIRFGASAAHYALFPKASAPEGAGTPEDLGAELAARLRQGPVDYELRVQLFVDEARTPIEDSSVEWREQDAPFVPVARLRLPRQDPDSPRGRRVAAFVEALSFDPWHAQEVLRPLGEMMRARNVAYRESTRERGAAGEPDGSERFDEPEGREVPGAAGGPAGPAPQRAGA